MLVADGGPCGGGGGGGKLEGTWPWRMMVDGGGKGRIRARRIVLFPI